MGGSASSPASSSSSPSSSSSSSISSSCGASCRFMAMKVMPPTPALPPPPPPSPSPPSAENHDYWKRDSTSVSAVSFGFVATAVLISLFLIVAIFERFLRRPPAGAEGDAAHVANGGNNSNGSSNNTNSSNSNNPDRSHSVGFRLFPSLKGHSESRFEKQHTVEISVLMPGQRVPTFIANPVPIPCSREYGDGSIGTCGFNCARSICSHLSGKPSEVAGTATI